MNPNQPQHVSLELRQFTKHSENEPLFTAAPNANSKAWMDNGAYSIGYGHRSEAITATTVWTKEQCENAFEWDMQRAEDAVHDLVNVPLNQGQFDCLCDFVYNEGAGKLHGSMLLAALNQGNYARVPLELYRVDPETNEEHGWIFAGGVKNAGLIERRKGEIAFWNGQIAYAAPVEQEAHA